MNATKSANPVKVKTAVTQGGPLTQNNGGHEDGESGKVETALMHQLPGHVGHHHHHQHDARHHWGVKEGCHHHHQQEVGQVQHAALKHLQLAVCSNTKQPQVVMVGQV